MPNVILKKHKSIEGIIRYIRVLSLYGFSLIFLITAKEIYDREQSKKHLLETTNVQLERLLIQYESAIRLSESLHKDINLRFLNNLIVLQDDYPRIISIERLKGYDKKIGLIQGDKIKFLLGNHDKFVYVEMDYNELLQYLLSKTKAKEWFNIKIEGNVDDYQVRYNGVTFVEFLIELVVNHNFVFLFFCVSIVLFWASKVLRKFFVDVTETIEKQDKVIDDLDKIKEDLAKKLNHFKEYQKISDKTLYLIFNRVISDNTNALDKEEEVDVFSLVQEAILMLGPKFVEKNIYPKVKGKDDHVVKVVSREILLIVLLNYIYRSIMRSVKDEKIRVVISKIKNSEIIIEIIDNGYFFVEKSIEDASDVFCLPKEYLILLETKMGIEVDSSKGKNNTTSINLGTVKKFGKNNVITLQK